MTGYFRVSGDKVFNYLTFDAVYRVQGSNMNLDDLDPLMSYPNYIPAPPPENEDDEQLNFQTRKMDGEGSFGHTIALFAQPSLGTIAPDLNVSLGYSLSFQSQENISAYYNGTGLYRAVFYNINDFHNPFRFHYDNSVDIKRSAPFFHGIDLRANYSGIEKIIFNTQNNISFASAKGSDTDIVYGLRPSGTYSANDYFASPYLKKEESDKWFYVYNTLGVRYELSANVYFHAGIASRFGALTEVRNTEGIFNTLWRTNHWISAELMAFYILPGTGWELAMGLACMQQNSAYENISTGKTASVGRFTAAIPLLLRWALRKQ